MTDILERIKFGNSLKKAETAKTIKQILDFSFVLLCIACFVCAFYAFQSTITQFIVDWILPLVDFKPNTYTDILVVVIAITILFCILYKGPNRYSFKHIGILATLWFFYINYAITDDFIFTCIDGMPYMLLLLIAISIGMTSRPVFCYIKTKHIEFEKIDGYIQLDAPIEKDEEDVLGFLSDVKYIMNVLEHTEAKRSTSIGINAPWGTGKTSFFNLLEKRIKEDNRFVFIKFNPRGSAKVENIQSDFMNVLSEEMKQYHSSFTSYVKQYVKTLQLIDNKNPLIVWFSFFGLDSVETSKQKISTVLSDSKNKLVVLIDDFDRLTAKEIIEVLKLIDINSSFPNSFFITAYDKFYVNDVLCSELGYETAFNYTDKYFSVEYTLPEPSYCRKIGLLESLLRETIENGILMVSHPELNSTLMSLQCFLESHLPNLRDIKRFYNQLISTYIKIGRDVIFNEYFTLSLMKYVYPEEYRNLALKKYIDIDSTHITSGIYVLNNEAQNANSIKLLNILFPKKRGESPSYLFKDKFRHISYPKAFDTYFKGFEIGNLYYENLAPLLDVDCVISEVLEKFKGWNTVGEQNDVVDYLLSTDFRKLDNEKQLKQYIQVLLIFTYNYGLDLNMGTALLGIFSDIHMLEIDPHYGLKKDAYKALLEDALIDFTMPEIPTNFLNWFVIQLAREPEISSKSMFKMDEVSKLCHSRLLKTIERFEKGEANDVQVIFRVLEGCAEKVGDSAIVTIRNESLNAMIEFLMNHPVETAPLLLFHFHNYKDKNHC